MDHEEKKLEADQTLSRKEFLRLAALGGGAAWLAACAPTAPTPPAPTTAPPPATQATAQPTVAAKPKGIAAKASDTVAKWRHGIVPPQFNAAFQKFSDERGHWKDEKIEVEFVVLNTDTLLIKALIAGEVDSIEITPSATIASIEGGSAVKLIGAYQPGLVHALAVQPSITSLKDLQGKKVGITGKGALIDTVLRAVLIKNNLEDVYSKLELVSTPGLPALVQNLLAKQIDAAGAISVDYYDRVEEAGNKLLVHYAEALPEFLRFTLILAEKTIKEKPEIVTRWFVGYGKGIRDFLDKKDEAIKFAIKVAQMSEADARKNYDYYIQKKLFQPNAYIEPKKIEDFQRLNKTLGNQKEVLPVEKIVDYTFQKKVIEILGPYPGYPYAQ